MVELEVELTCMSIRTTSKISGRSPKALAHSSPLMVRYISCPIFSSLFLRILLFTGSSSATRICMWSADNGSVLASALSFTFPKISNELGECSLIDEPTSSGILTALTGATEYGRISSPGFPGIIERR